MTKFDEKKIGLDLVSSCTPRGIGAIGFALCVPPRYWFCPFCAAAAWRLLGEGGGLSRCVLRWHRFPAPACAHKAGANVWALGMHMK